MAGIDILFFFRQSLHTIQLGVWGLGVLAVINVWIVLTFFWDIGISMFNENLLFTNIFIGFISGALSMSKELSSPPILF